MLRWIMSDIHLEERGRPFMRGAPQPEHDIVVLAGDVARLRVGVAWAARTFSRPIVYVPGDVEFYDTYLFTELQGGQEVAARTHVAVLDDADLMIGGLRILGATLWTDFDLLGADRRDEATEQCRELVPAFRRIGYHMGYDAEHGRYTYGPMRPGDARERHLASREWLGRELAHCRRLGAMDRTVVMTHHAPARGSLLPRWRHALTSAAYVSAMTDLIEEFQPALWVHGHVHAQLDYRIDRTRILANPLGHRWERTDFDPALDRPPLGGPV